MADKIQVYGASTPNGKKATIIMEELGVEYDLHKLNLAAKEQKSEDFLKINPNGRIPAIIDPKGPNGKETRVFESGAILAYLGEKYNKFYPKEQQQEILAWIFLANTGLTPFLGQLYHFAVVWDKSKPRIDAVIDRFRDEVKRVLGVIDEQLKTHEYLAGDEYTVADINLYSWLANKLEPFGDVLTLDDYPNIKKWILKIDQRPAVQRGLAVWN